MFNDKYGLTDAVLEGCKTMTRRPVSEKCLQQAEAYRHEYYADTLDALPLEEALLEFSPFKVGEIVAVAQKYSDFRWPAPQRSGFQEILRSGGWNNKMFVRADLMPHQIRITNVRVERLQDISDEDCLKEGIIEGDAEPKLYGFKNGKYYDSFFSPREAFAALIDKVSDKGTWQSNPWVFVYEFELIK